MEKTETEEEAGFFQKRWVHISLIILLTFGVYANSFRNEFVYDDEGIIVKNDFIKDWKNVPKIFTKEYFNLTEEKTWRPICTLSFFVDYHIWKLNVFGWHLTNISFHTANAILVYFLVYLILSHSFTSSLHRSIASLLTALLFALHPIQTEAVNGISFREDLISFFFFLLAFLFYINSTRLLSQQIIKRSNRQIVLYFASCFFFALALLTKEMAITFPLVIVVYSLFFSRQIRNCGRLLFLFRNLKEYLPFLLVIFLWFLVNKFLLQGHILTTNIFFGASPDKWGLNYGQLLLVMMNIVTYYVKLSFFPMKLQLDADYVFSFYHSFFDVRVISSILLLICIFVIAIKIGKYVKELSFSIAYFFMTLLPVSNLVPFGGIIAERYLYFPLMGFCMFLAVIVGKAVASLNGRLVKSLSILCVFCILTLYILRVMRRNVDWRDELTLWLKCTQTSPTSYRARWNLGCVYERKNLLEQAIAAWERAIEIAPRSAEAHEALGSAYVKRGLYDEAITHYKKAIEIRPDYLECRYALANILLYTKKFYDEAILQYSQLLEINPSHVNALRDLGIAYLFKGAYREAIEEFKKILVLQPDNKRALQGYEEALRLYHASPDSEKNK